jgi:hypothetical protein
VSRYKAICRGLDHEAKVMNDRLTWAILFTAGLFAATAILMTAGVNLSPAFAAVVANVPLPATDAQDGTSGATVLYGQYCLLLILAMLIAIIAIWFSFATKGGVEAAQDQFDYLRVEYDDFLKAPGGKELLMPRPYGNPHDHVRGNKVARTFPWVMITIWTGALVVEGAAFLYFFGLWFGVK